MPTVVKCANPACGAACSVGDGLMEQAVRCPRCGKPFVPSAVAATMVVDTTTVGRYQTRTKLGAGAFGTVYRAYDPQLDREVALKLLKPEALSSPKAVERFRREARAAAKMLHPNIVPVHDAGTHGDSHYIASALIAGKTLSDLIPEGGMEPARAAALTLQLAEALAYAHQQNVLHRDVKPANVLVDGRDHLYLMDFGLAGPLQQERNRMTRLGAVMGTPAYMAPEQAAGDTPNVGAAADQYSAGVVLYEMLTGRTPFEGPPDLVLFNVLKTPPKLPSAYRPGLDPELEAICLRAMAKNPVDRFPGAAEFAAALREWLGDHLPATVVATTSKARRSMSAATLVVQESEKTTAPTPGAKRRPAAPRRRLVAAAVALLVLAPLAYFFGGKIIRIATNKGELVVENDDPDVEVLVNGPNVTIHDKGTDRRYVLTAGDYEITVQEKGGARFATKRLSITRGGKETFNARLELANAKPPDDRPPIAADRRAALWVLSVGGTVRVDDQAADIRVAAELPKGSFRLKRVGLRHNDKLADADLARLADCADLTHLDLYGTTTVTDAGLAHLKNSKNLTLLFLGGTRVTDAGLANFKACTGLTQLHLARTNVGDAGLAALSGCTGLTHLWLDNTRVTDAALATVGSFKNLTYLEVYETQVTDAGLERLKALIGLTQIDLHGTKVTAAGVDGLHNALPKCTIISDFQGGADRSAAEWVLTVGGKVTVRSGNMDRPITALADLPQGEWQLTSIDLNENKRVTPEGLRRLAGLTSLTSANLSLTPVGDEALEALKASRNLVSLVLWGVPVTDAGVAHLSEHTKLTNLCLSGTKVTDAGMKYLRDLTNLESLDLGAAPLTETGIAHLAGLTRLKTLYLGGSRANNFALEHLLRMTELTTLDLHSSNVSDPGLERLEKLSNLTDINLAGTRITDAGLKRLTKLTKLASLSVGDTTVGDDGLANLAKMTHLTSLGLHHTRVTDDSLAHLKTLTNLTNLDLNGTHLVGTGLQHLRPLSNLTTLGLSSDRLTDAGLANVKALPNLTYLELSGTPVTDAGLEHLKALTKLTQVNLPGTKVTQTGVKALHEALPRCTILWNGGTIAGKP